MNIPRASVAPDLFPPKSALETAFQVVRKAKVPQIPDIVLALKREMAGPNPDVRVIADLVSQDLVITGRLLKTINSPAFNLRGKIGSVQQAVALMGVTRLTNLVTAEVISRMLENTAGSVRVIWECMMEEARVIAAISRVVKVVTDDEAYLFGMMHDVGCLLFGNMASDYGNEWILRGSTSPDSLLAYETAVMGVTHTTVGFLLAQHWQLPEHLALAVYHHHDQGYIQGEDQRVRGLIAMSKLGHYLLALSHGTHEIPEMQAYRDDAWQELEISERDWSQLVAQAEQGLWNQEA